MKANMRGDFEEFQSLKNRFGVLAEELNKVNKEWEKIHQGIPYGEDHVSQHEKLSERQAALLDELYQLMDSAAELILLYMDNSAK